MQKIWSDHSIINIETANSKHMLKEQQFLDESR